MALDSKKYSRMFSETGSDADKITTDEKAILNAAYADNSYLKDMHAFKFNAALLLQIDNITRELDHLRLKIAANESCCETNTAKTGITTTQAAAIVTNTAKVSRNLVTSSVAGSTAQIKDMLYVNDKTLGLCLQIQVDVLAKGKVQTKSTKLQLT